MQFLKNSCLILSNFLLKVHKFFLNKKQEKQKVQRNYIEERKQVAILIMDVLVEKCNVREALSQFPKNCNDNSISIAWHALLHFEADEDISSKDKVFRDVQVDFLEGIYNILSEGHELPKTLIDGYNKYHKGVDTSQVAGSDYFWHEMKKNLNIQE